MSDVRLTESLALLAAESLSDVFTPEGDAVVVDVVDRKLGRVRVTGNGHAGEWFAFAELTAGRDLLLLEATDAAMDRQW